MKLNELNKKNNLDNESHVIEVNTQDVAVIGVALRFPHANSIEEFEANLSHGIESIDDFPKERKTFATDYLNLKNVKDEYIKFSKGGYLNNVDNFDYRYYRIPPKEAELMDPAQRLFLQVATEALVDSGYTNEMLSGSKTGVFLGYSPNKEIFDYQQMILDVEYDKVSMSISGNMNSIIPSRVAYYMNLKGPSMLIDTACSSSLVAVHLACRSLQNGECEYAIAGGARITLFPLKDYGNIGIESSDGRTKTFDAKADGTGIGEGVAAIILKPYYKALEDNDNVYAIIKGSAINQDGASSSITAPNGLAQEEVIEEAWKNAQIDPQTITYIEAHGTGTKLGDPIEIQSINKAFLKHTEKKNFCAIGSVKTNIGHTYASAGIASLIKCILSLRNKKIYPSLNYSVPNPEINFNNSAVYVNTILSKWNSIDSPRRCGVSSFGFSGTNCHMVLEEFFNVNNSLTSSEQKIFTLSSFTQERLNDQVLKYLLILNNTEVDLDDICYTLNITRKPQKYRIAFAISEKQELIEKLHEYLLNGSNLDECHNSDKEYSLKRLEEILLNINSESNVFCNYADELCELFIAGHDIDWQVIYKNSKLNKLHLPLDIFNQVECTLVLPAKLPQNGFLKESVKIENSNDVLIAANNSVVVEENDASIIEKAIAKIWSEVLGYKKTSVRENFFELGGDSITLMQIIQRISDQYNVNIPMKSFVENATIKSLSQYVESNRTSSQQVIYPHQSADPQKLNEPFGLTEIQKAYLIGRDSSFELGGIGTHIYSEIETELDIEKLNVALNKLIKKHPMLRAVFINETQQQVVLEEIPHYNIKISDISSYGNEDQKQMIYDERSRMSHHVFNPTQWPLFEMTAYKLSPAKNYIFFGYDMLIADGLSIRIFEKELLDFYHNPELKADSCEFSFRDYMIAYEEFKNSDVYMKDQQYHLDNVGEMPIGPTLLLKKSPSEVKKTRFTRKEKLFTDGQWDALKSVAKSYHVTPTAILLFSYAKMLNFWSSEDRFSISLTVFNRYPFNKEVNKIIGDFTSVMHIDMDFSENKNLADELAIIQSKMLEKLDHRHFDGVNLIREMSKINNTGSKAIMPVVFTSMLIDERTGDIELKERLGNFTYGVSQTSQVYLDNQIVEINGGLSVTWDYIEELFDEKVINLMFDQYTSIINNIIAKEDLPQLTLLEKDKNKIATYNNTDKDINYRTLDALFSEMVSRFPNNICVIGEDEQYTYKEIDLISNQIAKYLIDKGLKPGECAGVIADRKVNTIANILGILKAGGVYVPIEPDYPEDRKKYVISNSDISVILCVDTYSKEKIFELSDEKIVGLSDLDSLAYIIYTSGSTGTPKGVMITHKSAANTILDINQRFNITEEDKIIGLSSMCFDLSVYDIFGALSTGASLYMVPNIKDTEKIAEIISKYQITFWNSVPSVVNLFVENLSVSTDKKFIKYESLKHILMSGDWIPVNLPEKIKKYFPNTEIISLGGATEGSIWSIFYPINEVNSNWKSIPYGYPLSNQKFYVLNRDMEFCPIGTEGELYIGGTGVASGYMKDLKKTKSAFLHHPDLGYIYRTGDFGILKEEGYIEFRGRKDAQVKIRGHRIELGEIESQILRHNSVETAIVQVKEIAEGEKKIIAYIVPKNKDRFEIKASLSDEINSPRLLKPIDSEKIKEHLVSKLPEYMIPFAFIYMDYLPLTGNQKIDVKKLPNPQIDTVKNEQAIVKPKDKFEEGILEIWQEVLKISNINLTDTFFNLGGDSLQIYQISTKIDTKFNVKIPIDSLYKEPTIVNMANYVKNELKLTGLLDESKIVTPEVDEILYWNPNASWILDKETLYINSIKYNASNVFPDLYYSSQKGISKQKLVTQLAAKNSEINRIVDEFLDAEILITSLPNWRKVFGPTQKIYVNHYDEDLLFNKDKYQIFRDEQMNRQYGELKDAIVLEDCDEYLPHSISKRRSYRNFKENEVILKKDFSTMLSVFKQNNKDGNQTFYYASSGGLYPIDIYLYVKKDRVEGVEQGLYYYSPSTNKLNVVDKKEITESSAYVKNKEIFKSSAITIYMFYNADASMPVYGSDGYYYAILDAGIMVSTLTQICETLNLGLCSIGDMNFEVVKENFHLSKNQIFIHNIEIGVKPDRMLSDNEVRAAYEKNNK